MFDIIISYLYIMTEGVNSTFKNIKIDINIQIDYKLVIITSIFFYGYVLIKK